MFHPVGSGLFEVEILFAALQLWDSNSIAEFQFRQYLVGDQIHVYFLASSLSPTKLILRLSTRTSRLLMKHSPDVALSISVSKSILKSR
jgi:hypothetical protein